LKKLRCKNFSSAVWHYSSNLSVNSIGHQFGINLAVPGNKWFYCKWYWWKFGIFMSEIPCIWHSLETWYTSGIQQLIKQCKMTET